MGQTNYLRSGLRRGLLEAYLTYLFQQITELLSGDVT